MIRQVARIHDWEQTEQPAVKFVQYTTKLAGYILPDDGPDSNTYKTEATYWRRARPADLALSKLEPSDVLLQKVPKGLWASGRSIPSQSPLKPEAIAGIIPVFNSLFSVVLYHTGTPR